jgi:hypothetical protein
MTFLAPLFLLGLAALAVPVVIHLTQRERKTVVEFPSLMFLRRVPYESVQRRRIRDWLLLALRAAALAIIIAAFARPLVRGSELAAAAGGAREVVLLVDRSYSMSAGDSWTRAQQAARRALQTIGPSDRVSLVFFGSGAELVLRSSTDAGRVGAEVDAARPGAGATRFAPALKLAARVLAESQLPRKEVVIVSDFQRAGWQPDETLRMPAGTVVTPEAIAPPTIADLAVTPLTLTRAPFEGQERVGVSAGILNRGASAATDLNVRLEMDGRVIQTNTVTVAPGGAAKVTFAPVAIPSANTRLAVRIPDDDLAADNAFYAVVAPPAPVPVAVVSGNGRGAEADLYLTRALAIGTAPRFEATALTVEGLSADALTREHVVILEDVALPDTVAARLETFVQNGGGLVVALGARSTLPAGGTPWWPAAISGTADRSRGTPAKLSGIDYGHAIFEPFRAPRSGDFTSVRVYGYRTITAAQGASVIARFDAGEPALVEKPLGKGRVIVFAMPFDLSWSDLPLKPVFLPFVHQLTRHAASYREQPLWLTVGQALDLASLRPQATSGTALRPSLVLTPSGQRVTPTAAQPAVELREQGFYEVREQARESQPAAIVASNVELGESDFTIIDPREIVVAVSGRPGDAGPGGPADVIPDALQEQAQRVWWYLLFAGILLLIAETLVARRLARTSR